MKIVYFGTPYFAVRVLEYLMTHAFPIHAVVTRPDRPKGRALKIGPSPVKQWLQKKGVPFPIFSPEKASDPSFIESLRKLQANFFVVVGYGQILKPELLSMPSLECINVHASLLPKYRGAEPIRRCLLAGEKETGITIMKMVKEMDAGEIYAQKKVSISDKMNFGELQEELIQLSGPLLEEVIVKIQQGKIQPTPQEHAKATFARKIAPQEREISWQFSASQIHCQIQAFSPSPGAWCWMKEEEGEKKKLKILRSSVVDQTGAPGEVVECSKKTCVVACQEKALQLLQVQLEGKKPLPISSFLCGIRKKIFFF